jgi:hypothetical protein
MSAIINAIYYVWYRLSDSSVWLLHSPLVAVAALECLIAIWAAQSRAHWLWRWLAVVAGVTLMVPARAWPAAWFFGLALPLIVTFLSLANWLQQRAATTAEPPQTDRPRSFRFSLGDLFLVTVAIAAVLPLAGELARHFQPFNPLGWIASAGAMAALAALCVRCISGPRRTLAAVVLMAALPLTAVVVRLAGDWTGVWYQVGIFHDFNIDVGTLITLETHFGLVLLLVLALVKTFGSPLMLRPIRFLAAGALALAMTAILGWGGRFYAQFLKPVPQRAEKFVAVPNHYDRIGAIANRVNVINKKNVSIAELDATSQKIAAREMEALLTEVLPLLDAANAVPYDPETDARQGSRTDNFVEVQPLRGLARTLTAEAKAAMQTGDTAKAAAYSIAILRLGGALGRGGTAIQAIIGTAVEGVGYGELARIRAQLTENRQRNAIAALQRLLAEREDTKAILDRDADFKERAYGFPERLGDALYEAGSANWVRFRLDEYICDREAINLLLQTDLAIRLFQRDRQHLPRTLAELSPQYLPHVPIDPYDGKPLRYRPGSNDFVLYSVGFDRYDDGGKFGKWPDYHNARSLSWRARRPQIDLSLESMIEPEMP